MSAISSASLVFLLLLSMIIVCDARRLSDTIQKEPAKRSHLSSKKDETASVSDVSVVAKFKPALSTAEEKTEKGTVREEKRVADKTARPARSSNPKKKHIKQSSKGTKNYSAGDDVVQNESKASVSWRVPHKKHTEHEPGFNLDYSPPKTHPPSHN